MQTHNPQDANTRIPRKTRSKRFVLNTLALLLLLPAAAVAAPQDEEDTVFEDATEESAGTPASAEKPSGKRTVLDDVVVTATRSEQRLREVPSRIEVLDSHDIEMTVGNTITEQLKKGSSVDVIEYPGVLAGIGIRGFRPEFDGITKHSLMLLNGRPVGATNLATVLTGDIERVEVLKGPASSLYGAEAMGGVVNIITKSSKGDPTGFLKVGGGSFDTFYQQAAVGGSLFGPIDFDLNARNFAQEGDLTMGSGRKRDNTSYRTRNGSLRIGADIGDDWRVDISGNAFQGRDIDSPGDIAYGTDGASSKDVDNYGADIKVAGQLTENDKLTLTAYHTYEKSLTYRHYDSGTPGSKINPVHKVSPYPYYRGKTIWDGVQLQNIYNWGDHSIIIGGDYQHIDSESRGWQADGRVREPSAPDSARTNWAGYGETVWKFLDKHLILTAGGRYDWFEVETFATPGYHEDTFVPKSPTFSTFSPRVGATYLMDNGLRLHTTLGQAFVPPTAQQMSYDYHNDPSIADLGNNTIRVTDRHLIGNGNLEPEKSTTWDVGLGFDRKDVGFSFDVTYFYTKVKDRITSVTTNTDSAPYYDDVLGKYVIDRYQAVNYRNSDDAEIQGLELSLAQDFGALFDWGRSLRVYLNATYYFKAEETNGGVVSPIMNVGKYTYNYGIGYEDNNFDAKLQFRSVGKMYDTDWVTGSPTYGNTIDNPVFTVADLVLTYSFLDHHKLTFQIDNIFDKDYYEKKGYNKPGRSFFVNYAYNF